jgi:hypothetical protein
MFEIFEISNFFFCLCYIIIFFSKFTINFFQYKIIFIYFNCFHFFFSVVLVSGNGSTALNMLGFLIRDVG